MKIFGKYRNVKIEHLALHSNKWPSPYFVLFKNDSKACCIKVIALGTLNLKYVLEWATKQM